MESESLLLRIYREEKKRAVETDVIIRTMPQTKVLFSSPSEPRGQWHHEGAASRRRLRVTDQFNPNKQNRRFRRT